MNFEDLNNVSGNYLILAVIVLPMMLKNVDFFFTNKCCFCYTSSYLVSELLALIMAVIRVKSVNLITGQITEPASSR